MLAAQANMAEAGFTIPHHFGTKHLFAHKHPPLFVWVPLRIRERGGAVLRTMTEYRTLFGFRTHFNVYIWGANYDHAAALMECVVKAAFDATHAELAIEGGDWFNPSAANMQRGERLRIELSLVTPLADRYLDPAILNGAVTEETAAPIPEPEPPTVIPTRVEGDMHLASSTNPLEDDEFLVKVSTSP